MLSEAAVAALRDILRHIDLAVEFIAGSDPASFTAEPRTVYAVTRCPEVISEASRRLPDELKARHPSIAWRAIADAANIYRHVYEDVAEQQLWNTVQIDLPPLRAVITDELSHLAPKA